MANKMFWVGILVMVLVFGMTVVGCDNGSTGSDGGTNLKLDSALVAKWYLYPNQDDDPNADPLFEITATGRLTSKANTNGEINVTTSGGKISATVTMNGQTAEFGTVNYFVLGDNLQLSNPMFNDAPGGVFLSFVSAIQMAQSIGSSKGADGYLHKGRQDLTGNITISHTISSSNDLITFAAIYTGTETVSYQWKSGNTNVGTNAATYTYTPSGEKDFFQMISRALTVTVSAAGYKSKTSPPFLWETLLEEF